MSTIFVSHSSKDHKIALEIASWLKQKNYASVFLDFDPADGIPAGRNWTQELYKELKSCRAMLILCSESSQSSEWCFAEFFHAKALGKAIFPIKVAPCTLRPLIAELQVIDLTHNQKEGFERLRRGLSEAGMDPGSIYTQGIRPPYPGLAVYQEDDWQIFFGREAEIQECLDTLRKLREFGGDRLVLVLGASGSGKSSLIRAGVIPRLKRAHVSWRVVGPVRPSLLVLDEGLNGVMSQFVTELDQKSLLPGIIKEPQELNPASPKAQPMMASGIDYAPIVFIDQFEELLDNNLSTGASSFLNQLSTILHSSDCRILTMATLRSDFLGEFQQHPAFRDIRFTQLSIGPLSKEGFAKVIEEPAKLEEIEIESGLVQTMVDDTETGDALPLLAFTLRELWEHHGKDHRLTLADYNELGGLEGSVARAAEAVLSAEASSEEQKEDLRNAFIPLVLVDDQGRYVRRRVSWSSIDQQFHALLERFVEKRLLVSKSEESEKGERVLEVAHEALFRTWQRLKKWLDEDKENLLLREGLRRAAKEWEKDKRPRHLLNHRDVLLDAVEKLAVEPRFAIDSVERDYLDACIEVREEKKRRELAERHRLYGFIIILALAVMAISGFWYLADSQRKNAQMHLTSLHWVNGVFARDRSRDILKASHHFMAAAESATDNLESHNAYLAGALLTRGIHLGLIMDHDKNLHDRKLKSAVFGRDPQQILTWDEFGTRRIWDLRNGGNLQPEEKEFEGNPVSINTSPREGWIMGKVSNATVRIVEASSGRVIRNTEQKQGWPVFNDDESKLASWNDDGQVSIFDITRDTETTKLQAPFELEKVVLSRSGERLLLLGKNNDTNLWTSGNASIVCKHPNNSKIIGAVFSPDDSHMFSWSSDGSASLLDTRGGCKLIPLPPGHADNPPIMGAIFNHNGRYLFTWNYGSEGTLSRWDMDTGRESTRFQYENNPGNITPASSAIRRGILNKDESRLLTASDDGKAIIWDVESGKELRVLTHQASVRGAIFNSSEKLVLTWSDDGSAKLWNADSGEEIAFPLAHAGRVRRAMFNEDGKNILTWGDDGAARLWIIEEQPADIDFKLTEPPITVFWKESARELSLMTSLGNLEIWSEQGKRMETRHLADAIQGGQFNHDGSQILTRSKDHTVRLWNSQTGQPLTDQLRHQESAAGILGVAYSPDEQWLLSWGDDRTARLWDIRGKPILTLQHGATVRGAAVNSDRSRVLTWSDERLVRIWDTGNGKVLRPLEHNFEVLGASFLMNSSEILTWSSDGLIRVWDAETGAEKRVFHHGDELAGAISNSDGSRLLGWATDGTARLWDTMQIEREVCPELIESAGFDGGSLNADNGQILTWTMTGVVRLWDDHTGQPLTKALQFGMPLVSASLSRDGSRILAWSEDGSVKIWSLDIPKRQTTPVLQQEVRTGTRLNNQGEVNVMYEADWNEQERKSPLN